MNKKRGLGRGLEALIPMAREGAGRETVIEIPLEDIVPGQRQARKTFDEAKLRELSASIKDLGVIQPIVVRMGKEGGFELIAGERRWRASKEAGLKMIPAVVRDFKDEDAAAVSLVENIQRADLNPLEEAAAYKQLMEDYGMTQEQLAGRVGKSRSLIANTIRLLELPESIKTLVYSNDLTAGHARALLALTGKEKRIAAAEAIKNQGLNVRQTERLVQKLIEADKQKKTKSQPAKRFYAVLEIASRIENSLGCPAKIRKKRKGKFVVELELGSEADLLKLIDTITLKPR